MEIAPNETQSERFVAPAEQMLRQAGWYPGRQLSATELEPWYLLPRPGLLPYWHIIPAALRVLREFGGLYVQPSQGYTTPFYIDPIKAIQKNREGGWLGYEWAIEDSLFPLGYFENDEHIIAITNQGHIYAIGEEFIFIADSFDKTMNNTVIAAEFFYVGDHEDRWNRSMKYQPIHEYIQRNLT